MNWDDKLCGFVVTPQSWVGGVVAVGHSWRYLDEYEAGTDSYGSSYTTFTTFEGSPYDRSSKPWYSQVAIPIYPPRGWNGISEAKIRHALYPGFNFQVGKVILHPKDWPSKGWWFGVPDLEACPIHELPQLINDARNAQVFSDRLKEGE